MTRAIVFVIAFFTLLMSLSSAATVTFTQGWLGIPIELDPGVDTPFRISTSETAYIEHLPSAGSRTYTAADGPNVAAFMADLTNGVNNPITWSINGVSETMVENYFFTLTPTLYPLLGFSTHFTQPSVDFAPFATIEGIRLTTNIQEIPRQTSLRRYGVRIDGQLPEPSNILLAGLCLPLLHHHRRKVR